MATSQFVSAKGLTPPLTFNTNVPFLRPDKVKLTNEDGTSREGLKLVEDQKQGIVLQSISEFSDYHVKGSFFDSDSQVVLLHDGKGQPMIFTVGTNKVRPWLYLLHPETLVDMTRGSVSTFCLW